MPGHPDGQNYAIWRGPDFFANPTFPISASNPVNASGQVTNFASLIINTFGNPAGGLDVLIQWFTDQTATIETAAQEWTVPAGFSLSVMTPCLGNFVKVTVTTTTVAATNTPISIYPTNTPATGTSYLDNNNKIQGFNVSIPLSSTLRVPFGLVMSGNGYVYLSDRFTTGKLTGRVVTVNQAGTSQARLVSYNTLVPFQAQLFVAPSHPLFIEIDNADATAAHVVDYFMSIDGR